MWSQLARKKRRRRIDVIIAQAVANLQQKAPNINLY
jgi:hypothetical protein